MNDPRVLGLPVRVRNARVAARAGVTLDVPPHTLIDLPVGEAAWNVSTARGRRRAGWAILRRTAKPSDGWVSRHLNRPISRVVSYAMLSLRLEAAHASLLTLAVGLGAAVVAAQPGYWPLVVTGILFHIASVLDGVDGEMARATLTESPSGARLDTIVDQLTYAACFVGETVGWIREGHGRFPVLATLGVGAALALSVTRGGRFVARHAHTASFVAIDRAVRRAARDTGRPTLRMAAAAFALLRRDAFALVFLAVCFTGQRALIVGLIAVGILIANVTFSTHRTELAAAAAAERLPST